MRLRQLDHEREDEAAPRPAVRAAPTPQIARILALQGSAGNQAVGRMLARLTLSDVKRGDAKVRYETAKAKYEAGFDVGRPLRNYPRRTEFEFSDLFSEAETVEELVAAVDKVVKSGEEWLQRQQQQAQANAQPAQNAAPVQATQMPSQRAQQRDPTPKPEVEPQREKKQKKFAQLDMTQVEAANPWDMHQPQGIHTADPNPTLPGQILPPTQRVFDITEYTNPITSWDRRTHGGKRAQSLTLENARAVVTWLTSTYPHGTAVFVCRGPGSGGYSSQTQLKIIHRANNVGSKKATYHLSLAKSVYDQLTEVEFAGADWGDTS